MSIDEFRTAVLAWYDRHGRKDLPWQILRTPYRVWVSEIMLQQTQVAAVIPYFQRFISRFPDIAALATASDDDAIALWAGLGYYARVRNLCRAAHMVGERHGGHLPAEIDALLALPGVGRSTAGAILSLGFGLRAPILDGNVKRVLCRHAGIAGWPGESRVARMLWELSEAYTPEPRVADYNQAMMDLGAGICTPRRPTCGVCPLQPGCVAARTGQTATIPAPKPRRKLPVRRCLMLVLRDAEGRILLEKRPPVGIWGGLWSLPEFEDEERLASGCATLGVDMSMLERLPPRRHTFSHYHLDYRPVIATPRNFRAVSEPSAVRWFRPESLAGLPAPVQRLLEDIADGTTGRP